MHVYICIYIYIYKHIYIYTYTYIHTYVYILVHTHIYRVLLPFHISLRWHVCVYMRPTDTFELSPGNKSVGVLECVYLMYTLVYMCSEWHRNVRYTQLEHHMSKET